jgi:hypothetical protein
LNVGKLPNATEVNAVGIIRRHMKCLTCETTQKRLNISLPAINSNDNQLFGLLK